MTLRIRRTVVALGLGTALALGASACSFATLDAQTPGVGVDTSASSAQVMNVLMVQQGSSARLVGSVLSPTDDTLVSIGGNFRDATGQTVAAMPTKNVNIALAANKLVVLDGNKIAFAGYSNKVADAQVTFTFKNAGSVTAVVPVTTSTNPNYTTAPATP